MAVGGKNKDKAIDILRLERGSFRVCVKGDTPLVMNRMSEKAKRQLLLPPRKKNSAERQGTLKHDPVQEFRASAYLSTADDDPTYLLFLASSFKASLRGAALDQPGAAKSQIGRLTWVRGERIAIYGEPKIFLATVRSAGMNRVPDVRSRLIIPRWACYVDIEFAKPLLTEQNVANLFAAAGITQGVGDWRTEKGSGNYGAFSLVEPDDKEFKDIIKKGGRNAQIKAMENPVAHDEETRDLLTWFESEVKTRGFDVGSDDDEENDGVGNGAAADAE